MRQERRDDRRFIKRIETTFSAGGITHRGISSNLSETGLFIRTSHAFVRGTIIHIELTMLDGTVSRLKGKVARASKTKVMTGKNGMGIEIVEKDNAYARLIEDLL